MSSPVYFLNQYPVKSTLPIKPIVSCRPDDLAKEALNSLIEHKILAMPVLSGNSHFEGIVDVTDFMVKIHGDTMDHPPVYRYAKEWLELHDAKVTDVISGSKRKPEAIALSSHMGEAAKKLILPGVHRVVVLDKENKVVNLVTQFFVLDLIYKHLEELSPEFLDKKVRSFSSYKPKELMMVNKVAKPIEAFRFLFHQNISAVPIVDDDGTLLATISEKDIRVILDHNAFPQAFYNQTCQSFAQKIKDEQNDKSKELSITESSTMRQIIQLLHDHKVHRLWVVNGEKKVINVVALKDVLEEFLSFSST